MAICLLSETKFSSILRILSWDMTRWKGSIYHCVFADGGKWDDKGARILGGCGGAGKIQFCNLLTYSTIWFSPFLSRVR
jgi:hypothetical protein